VVGPAAKHLEAPNPLDGFAISGTKVFPDTMQGVEYRYTKSGEPIFDVFIYPYSAPTLSATSEGRTHASQNEAGTFLGALPILRQQGYFDEYRVAFSAPDTSHAGSQTFIGQAVAVAIKRRGVVAITFFYSYGLPEAMVKVRVDVSMPQMKTANIPGFVHDLVAHLGE
jgi:hypothetical protein